MQEHLDRTDEALHEALRSNQRLSDALYRQLGIELTTLGDMK